MLSLVKSTPRFASCSAARALPFCNQYVLLLECIALWVVRCNYSALTIHGRQTCRSRLHRGLQAVSCSRLSPNGNSRSGMLLSVSQWSSERTPGLHVASRLNPDRFRPLRLLTVVPTSGSGACEHDGHPASEGNSSFTRGRNRWLGNDSNLLFSILVGLLPRLGPMAALRRRFKACTTAAR